LAQTVPASDHSAGVSAKARPAFHSCDRPGGVSWQIDALCRYDVVSVQAPGRAHTRQHCSATHMIERVLHRRDADVKIVLLGIILDSMSIRPADEKNNL
jgi:hypothetical protein